MKNLILLFLIGVTMASCVKEPLSPVNISAEIRSQVDSVELITIGTEQMLKFSNHTSFENWALKLDGRLDDYEETFVNSQNITSNSVNWDSLELNYGYNEFEELEDFEDSLNFSNSLRDSYISQEQAWMNDTTKLHPFAKYEFSGGEIALVNSNQRYMVGDTIYSFEDDMYYKVWGDYITNLAAINNGNATENDFMGIFGWGNPNCKRFATNSSFHFYYKRNLITYIYGAEKVKFRSYFSHYTFNSHLKSYKLDLERTTFEPIFKKYRANFIEVGAQEQSWRKKNCTKYVNTSFDKKYRYNRNSLSITRFIIKNGKCYNAAAFETKGCFGFYQIDYNTNPGNQEYSLALEW